MPAPQKNTAQVETPRVSEFTGLNNVIDPLHLGLADFSVADNIDISVSKCINRAQGWPATPNYVGTAVTGCYATEDLQRLYVFDNGAVSQLDQNLNPTTLAALTDTTDPVYCAEVNGDVYYTNGTDYGLLTPGGWTPWGIPTPAAPLATLGGGGGLFAGVYQFVCTLVDANGLESSNSDVVVVAPSSNGTRIVISNIPQVTGYTTNLYVTPHDSTQFQLLMSNCTSTFVMTNQDDLGMELPFWNLYPPRGIKPAYYGGKIYTMEYFPELDLTMLWPSKPLDYHHFDLRKDGVAVPGSVGDFRSTRETHFLGALRNEKLTARGVTDTLMVGTDREIYSYDEDQLVLHANYGIVPGQNMVELHGKLYFWTKRGFCRAMPFENLTQEKVSVPPGLSAAAAVIEADGTRRYVVALQSGGTAYNPFVKT